MSSWSSCLCFLQQIPFAFNALNLVRKPKPSPLNYVSVLDFIPSHKRFIVVASTIVMVTLEEEWLTFPCIDSDIWTWSQCGREEQTHLSKLKIAVGLTNLYKNWMKKVWLRTQAKWIDRKAIYLSCWISFCDFSILWSIHFSS